jgi:hypothetical protein
MPKNPVDYSKTIIYQIKCLDEVDFIYVGHTTNFRSRKSGHKNSCNNPNVKDYNMLVYQKIREHKGWENWEMIPLEEYACNSSTEARIREQEWIDKLQSTLNMRKSSTMCETKKEYYKQYCHENADKIKIQQHKKYLRNADKLKDYQKQYRHENVDKINERKNKRYICPCGGNCRWDDKHIHLKSIMHKNWWFMAFS